MKTEVGSIMSKGKRPAKRGKVDTRLEDTGIYNTFVQYLVSDDGTDIPVGRFPIQSHKLIRKGEVLAHIEAEVQNALDDGTEFKGEARDAAEMLGKLKAAMAESDIENVLYWGYFLGRAMERHRVRRAEKNAACGKKVRRGGAKGHEEAHGTQAVKDAVWQEMQAELDRQLEGGAQLTLARKRVAEKFSCCEKTVRRHTTPRQT
ncbi:MAG TPA: hypothetical protein VMY37_09965 [Thermoguttaceae bacterium]|nr:hypothetical protein [Thermoguttaceae bacterium]